MTVEELRTLLAENTDLVSGLFTTLSATYGDRIGLVQPTGSSEELQRLAASGLTPIEKILVLQRVPIFSFVSAEEMRLLADLAKTVRLQFGTMLMQESAAPALWVILAGRLVLESADAPPREAGAGDVIGTLATMAGKTLNLSARVVEPGIALRIDREDLFDLLGERPELLRQIFSRMFRAEALA
jgi:hypothetical protein